MKLDNRSELIALLRRKIVTAKFNLKKRTLNKYQVMREYVNLSDYEKELEIQLSYATLYGNGNA